MKRAQPGFTLIEVLAAIVLIAIVLPVAMHAISLSTSLGNVARHKAEAAVLAQSKINELIVTKAWQNAQLNGDFSPDQAEYRWKANLTNWDSSTMKQLDLHIFWDANGREQSVTVTTLLDTESN